MVSHEPIPAVKNKLYGMSCCVGACMTWVLAWREHLVLAEPVGQEAPETTDSIDAAMKFPTSAAARAWAEGLWGMKVFENSSRVFVISVNELIALRYCRDRHGLYWRMWLKKEWDRGDCAPELRQLRNAFGPAWLHKQRLVR